MLAAVLAGCGGSEEVTHTTVTVTASTSASTTAGQAATSPSTQAGVSTATTSQAQSTAAASSAVTAGNEICARRHAEVTALNAAVTTGASSKIAKGIARRAAVERRALGELQRLVPPPAVAADWHKVLEYGQVELKRTASLAEQARSHHVSARQTLSLIVTPTPIPVLAAAVHSGLKQCYLRGTPAQK